MTDEQSEGRMSFAYYVNEKLWLLTEQPDGWRSELEELEREARSRRFKSDAPGAHRANHILQTEGER